MRIASFHLCFSITLACIYAPGTTQCAETKIDSSEHNLTTPDWMTDAEHARLEALISNLNDDDLETRESATRSLITMGGGIEDLLEQRTAHPAPGADPVIQFALQRVLGAIRTQSAQAGLDGAMKNLDRAVELGALAYVPEDPALERTLSNISVTFTFGDTPLDGWWPISGTRPTSRFSWIRRSRRRVPRI